MPVIPAPPADKSGGYMVIKYTNGIDTHRMRVHIQGFNTSASNGSPSTPNPSNSYPYNTVPAAGGEAGPADTFNALMNVVKAEYDATWTFSLDQLVQNLNGALTPEFPLPTPAPVVGIATGNSPATTERWGEVIYNMKTALGHRARLVLIGPAFWNAAGPTIVTPTTGGDSKAQAIVAYLTSAATRIQGHDGQALIAPAHVTFPINRRLRRHYGGA